MAKQVLRNDRNRSRFRILRNASLVVAILAGSVAAVVYDGNEAAQKQARLQDKPNGLSVTVPHAPVMKTVATANAAPAP